MFAIGDDGITNKYILQNMGPSQELRACTYPNMGVGCFIFTIQAVVLAVYWVLVYHVTDALT